MRPTSLGGWIPIPSRPLMLFVYEMVDALMIITNIIQKFYGLIFFAANSPFCIFFNIYNNMYKNIYYIENDSLSKYFGT